MLALTFLIIGVSFVLVAAGAVGVRYMRTVVVAEDSIAITVNRDNFIKRVLPQGRHVLHPYESVSFSLETKTKLGKGRTIDVSTNDGILVKIDWSGTYALRPDLIAEDGRSQKLRNLPNAEKAITRNADILLRKLVGSHPVADLFNPAIRDRLERQLSRMMIDKLKGLGIALNNLNLQSIELPGEVAEALNKAKAIEMLDGAIRQVDPTTREVVRGAYQLDEILHWDQYLPVPSRHTMKRLKSVAAHN